MTIDLPLHLQHVHDGSCEKLALACIDKLRLFRFNGEGFYVSPEVAARCAKDFKDEFEAESYFVPLETTVASAKAFVSGWVCHYHNTKMEAELSAKICPQATT